MSKISNKKFGIFNNKQVILTTLNSEQNTKISLLSWYRFITTKRLKKYANIINLENIFGIFKTEYKK